MWFVLERAPRRAGQANGKRGTLILATTVGRDLAAVQLDQVLDDRQAQPQAAKRRVVDESAWRKRSKTNGRKSAAIPCPVSSTTIRTSSAARSWQFDTEPPCGVNLIALESRFQMIC